VEKYGKGGQSTDYNMTRRMRIACWTTKATNTNTGYVKIIAFPRQQWLRERTLMLRCTIFPVLLRMFSLSSSCVEIPPPAFRNLT
jgi:hypothetical protein